MASDNPKAWIKKHKGEGVSLKETQGKYKNKSI